MRKKRLTVSMVNYAPHLTSGLDLPLSTTCLDMQLVGIVQVGSGSGWRLEKREKEEGLSRRRKEEEHQRKEDKYFFVVVGNECE